MAAKDSAREAPALPEGQAEKPKKKSKAKRLVILLAILLMTLSGAGAGGGGQTTDAHFKDMTEMSRQPRDNKLKRELDFILDIPLDVSAELGRTRLLINELLQLGQGSVVELNKLAGEPLEVYVNGKPVARGEAVVINEKFGVRLTDIISPIERVKQLG